MTAQEHISWEHAHVVGHSMGAMVALKLAAAHPEHIDSLTLVSTTCGHLQSIPRSWRALWYSIQVCLGFGRSTWLQIGLSPRAELVKAAEALVLACLRLIYGIRYHYIVEMLHLQPLPTLQQGLVPLLE